MTGISPDASPVADAISTVVPGLHVVAPPARERLEEFVESFASDLLQEASLFEEGDRGASSTTVQYTTVHVDKAHTVVRERGKKRTPRPKWFYPLRRLHAFLYIAGGIAIPLAITEAWQWVFGGATALIGAYFVNRATDNVENREMT